MKIYKLSSVVDLFDDTTTGIPTYDDWLQEPESDDKSVQVQYVPPKQYIEDIGNGFWNASEMPKQFFNTYENWMGEGISERTSKQRIDEIKTWVMQGNKFPMLIIHYDENGVMKFQEGHHRAELASQLGIEKIPVLVITEK
tara:strand:+ start:59439 stop:59861 length:423 start_codon:yes stop_codon:yes gene_type:complete